MKGLLESVPNFSEGRNPALIQAIAEALSSVAGAALLHVDSSFDANRTVYTLAGYPDAVVEALKAGARCAFRGIDMAEHSGTHPRIGALDVLPLVPLSGMTMEDCSRMAADLASELAAELEVPFYLYAHSANREERRELSAIRRGGYEGLAEKLKDDAWAPDSGPRRFVPSWGATVCGARDFLIAWNVNLSGKDESIAKAIAARLRRGPDGRGRFPGLKAIGWYMEAYGCAQASCNVCDFRAAPLYAVYAEISKLAQEFGCEARGSELIGLIPLEAVLAAGASVLAEKASGLATEASVPDAEKAGRERIIAAAVKGLGLDSLRPFEPNERILELALEARGLM
jgi:glutamate formiminotransferase/formiminotetrahydrofolate cyclodeaminase